MEIDIINKLIEKFSLAKEKKQEEILIHSGAIEGLKLLLTELEKAKAEKTN